ncbi:glycoside hydrolase family 13 protein [Corallincola platygyrae]|uniref:Glycoside hydrolase family 13 protein n=1 Tax=Corallincola platygyrae TaxID=1193278 RepID=A0ABW4XLX7_9GAMM
MQVKTPDWVKHAVFYQIYPDRFARSARIQHARGLEFKAWGTDPAEQGYQGGDLYGIVDKLDYLKRLGINALYLNPIFSSASNHRYHTYDYLEVDPLLGGNAALRELIDQAHHRGIKVVLDGVFNHASRGFWAFHHILENGTDSPYLDWFLIKDWPLRAYHSDEQNPSNYEAWWNLPALPKFNIKNPGVRDYLLEVARFWLEFGIDGWRLDVPEEIDDEAFWQAFRREVKAINPDAYICGEIWGHAADWLKGDRFDATMNYTFAWSAMSFVGAATLRRDYIKEHMPLTPLSVHEYKQVVERMLGWYSTEVNHAQLNLLDSHDTARALWIMGEDKSALALCALLQMTLPGAPCIYYGDEVGMSGADDPFCREAYPWHEPGLQDQELLSTYQELIQLRHDHPVLRTGEVRFIDCDNPELLLFMREKGKQKALIVVNRTKSLQSLNLPASEFQNYIQEWPATHQSGAIGNQRRLAIPPQQGAVLLLEH